MLKNAASRLVLGGGVTIYKYIYIYIYTYISPLFILFPRSPIDGMF